MSSENPYEPPAAERHDECLSIEVFVDISGNAGHLNWMSVGSVERVAVSDGERALLISRTAHPEPRIVEFLAAHVESQDTIRCRLEEEGKHPMCVVARLELAETTAGDSRLVLFVAEESTSDFSL